MKLDRNINPTGRGKYALILLRVTPAPLNEIAAVFNDHIPGGSKAIDFGGEDADFFVIRLKDKYAAPALAAYACAALQEDPEYSAEIMELARRAAAHPLRKNPD